MKQIVLAMVFVMLAGAMAQATSVPPLVNYQGMLADADGKPLTGTKKIEFSLYDAAMGGNKVWGPQVFDSVPLVNGMFNVILSVAEDGKSSIAEAFGAKDRYLGIKVGDKAELAPRQQILSTPFAISSKSANDSYLVQGYDLHELIEGLKAGKVLADPSVKPGLPDADYDSGWFEIEKRERTYKFEIGFEGLPKSITAYYMRENGEILAWGMNQYGSKYQSNGLLLDFDEQGNLFVRLGTTGALHLYYYRNRDDDANVNLDNGVNLKFRVMLWK